MEQTLQESQYREQQLELTKCSLQRHLEQITEEKEERQKEAVSWFNALEVNKTANVQCRVVMYPIFDTMNLPQVFLQYTVLPPPDC